ncbi:uncharacterized protein LOC113387814 isoform X2 [Ctenocephalides felis]|nr:uncharacterized protein LOC113387814 isoform X2 [Ctenocephalides felis]
MSLAPPPALPSFPLPLPGNLSAAAAVAAVAGGSPADSASNSASGIDADAWPPFYDGGPPWWPGGGFAPPPPRPTFLEDSIVADGLTTCDLCSWARRGQRDGLITEEASTGLGWTLSLVIVSVISAAVGAVIMVTFLRCRRTGNTIGIFSLRSNASRQRNIVPSQATALNGKGPPNLVTNHHHHHHTPHHQVVTGDGTWSGWLGPRRPPLGAPTLSAENHYTHMDDAYGPGGIAPALSQSSDGNPGPQEALYAELDRESIRSGNTNPYQNSAYSVCCEAGQADGRMIISSPPSSAYYSDLSCGGPDHRDAAYEVVGLSVLNSAGHHQHHQQPPSHWDSPTLGASHHPIPLGARLKAIHETTTVPSDYI